LAKLFRSGSQTPLPEREELLSRAVLLPYTSS